MLGAVNPGRWNRKPPIGTQVKWGHPLAQGLSFCFVANGGATGLFDAVTHASYNAITGSPGSAINKFGPAIHYPSGVANQYVSFVPSNALRNPFKPPLTVLAVCDCTRQGGASTIGGYSAPTTFSGWELAYETFNTTGQVGFTIDGAGDIASGITSPAGPAVIAAAMDSVSSNIRFMVNGAFSSVAQSLTWGTVQATTVVVGAGGANGALGQNALAGNVNAFFIWQRRLQDTELAVLNQDPFAFLSGPVGITYPRASELYTLGFSARMCEFNVQRLA